ncbi:MAG: sigma-54-dependent Fis family transcriptional regulator, partial [Proteobacteria bacterium]|nr:sigma-54-dependent Fis family transcriptional regulator [Pseudomonadota bacterium]
NAIKTDVRIIAATLKDLSVAVRQGTFRDDLFYRLNVLPIRIPPLRHRIEDIPVLAKHFIQQLNIKLRTNVTGVSPEVFERWKGYDWPGNVRELENTVERAMVMVREGEIGLKDLPHDFIPKLRDQTLKSYRVEEVLEDLSIKKRVRVIEEELILKALERTNGNRTHAAKLLEISHRALLYKLKEYDLLSKLKK